MGLLHTTDGLVELGVDAVDELDDLHGSALGAEVGELDEIAGQNRRLLVVGGRHGFAHLDVFQHQSERAESDL